MGDDVEMADATPTTSSLGAAAAAAPHEFMLSRVLQAHKGDVKTVTTNAGSMLLSGGRDETVRMWLRRGGDYEEALSYTQTKGAVIYAIAVYEDENGWKVFVGRKDGFVAVYTRGSQEPLCAFRHHDSVVCCLYVDATNGRLVSGGWDNNVIVWPIDQIVPDSNLAAELLSGHNMSVWSVAAVEKAKDTVLSASADKTIRLWHGDRTVHVFKGHTDVVRALLVLADGERFLSAANDCTVRLWGIAAGVELACFNAPADEFIYGMTLVGRDTVVTCGEGGHLVVWHLNEAETEPKKALAVIQSVTTPVNSLWSVCGLSNGDIAASTNDGRILIYTRNESRKAHPDVLDCLDAELASRLVAIAAQQHSKEATTVTIKVALDDGAPNMELKYEKGKDPADAAEKFIKDNDLPISYLGEITEYIRANIPEAREYRKNAGGAGKVAGREIACEVLVEDGRKLVCRFRDGDDPSTVAQSFVEQHNLPIKYLQTIAQMVRVEREKGQQEALADFYDPLTGGSRFVPTANTQITGDFAADPLTGGGRYVPGASGGGLSDASAGYGDPLTSGGRYVPNTADAPLMPNSSLPIDKRRPRGELVPLRDFCIFGVEQFSSKAFDRLLADNVKTPEAFKLSPAQIELFKALQQHGPDAITDVDGMLGALYLGLQWSMSELLPIFDLMRIALLNETINGYYCTGDGSGDFRSRLLALLVSDSPEPLKVVLCRAICNAFLHEAGRRMAMDEIKSLMPVVTGLVLSSRPALQAAAASALCNWSLHLLRTSESVCELGPREDCVREIVKALEGTPTFGALREDALVRVMQAVSTLMWGDVTVIKLSKSRGIAEIATRIKDAIVDDSGKSLCRDIVEMTYAV